MRLKYTMFEVIVEVISFVFIVGTFAYLFMMQGSLPQESILHFDINGVADQWGDKSQIFKIPFIGLAIYTFATVLSFFPKRWNVGIDPTHKNAEKAFRYTKDMIIVIKAEIAVFFGYYGFTLANQRPTAPYFLLTTLIVLFGTIIFYMIKTSRAKKEGMSVEERMSSRRKLF